MLLSKHQENKKSNVVPVKEQLKKIELRASYGLIQEVMDSFSLVNDNGLEEGDKLTRSDVQRPSVIKNKQGKIIHQERRLSSKNSVTVAPDGVLVAIPKKLGYVFKVEDGLDSNRGNRKGKIGLSNEEGLELKFIKTIECSENSPYKDALIEEQKKDVFFTLLMSGKIPAGTTYASYQDKINVVLRHNPERNTVKIIAYKPFLGEDLLNLFSAGRLSHVQLFKLAYQVLRHPDLFQQKGIRHRDIKPENIIVEFAKDKEGNDTGDVVAHFVDFGYSKEMAELKNNCDFELVGTEDFLCPRVLAMRGVPGAAYPYNLATETYAAAKAAQEILSLIVDFQNDRQEEGFFEALSVNYESGNEFYEAIELAKKSVGLDRFTENFNSKDEEELFFSLHYEIRTILGLEVFQPGSKLPLKFEYEEMLQSRLEELKYDVFMEKKRIERKGLPFKDSTFDTTPPHLLRKDSLLTEVFSWDGDESSPGNYSCKTTSYSGRRTNTNTPVAPYTPQFKLPTSPIGGGHFIGKSSPKPPVSKQVRTYENVNCFNK